VTELSALDSFPARSTVPYRIDHMSEGRLVVSYHLSGLPTSSLIKGEKEKKWSRKRGNDHGDGSVSRVLQSLGTDVLSTQSTRDPEVVKGIKESMKVGFDDGRE
jgi:hypothetical protein